MYQLILIKASTKYLLYNYPEGEIPGLWIDKDWNVEK